MEKVVIYARVSSVGDRQSTDRQISDLTAYAAANGMGVQRVFQEHISGAVCNESRQSLNDCLQFAKNNGVSCILFSELSRLGRNTLNVLEMVKWLSDNKINAYFQKESLMLLDKNGVVNPTTTILISCLGMVAEIERENIKYRLQSGYRSAQKKGVKMGRKIGTIKTKEQKENQYKDVIKCLKKGYTCVETLAICRDKGIKCSIATVKRVKKEFAL